MRNENKIYLFSQVESSNDIEAIDSWFITAATLTAKLFYSKK